MRPNFREVGIANPTGPRTHARSGRTFKHGMITVEAFAVTSMADETFLTGVAYTDGIDDAIAARSNDGTAAELIVVDCTTLQILFPARAFTILQIAPPL